MRSKFDWDLPSRHSANIDAQNRWIEKVVSQHNTPKAAADACVGLALIESVAAIKKRFNLTNDEVFVALYGEEALKRSKAESKRVNDLYGVKE